MAEALGRRLPVELPEVHRTSAPLRAAARPVGRVAEPRRPVHLAVVVGLSASAYAGALAGVTALQAAGDLEVGASNEPAVDALTDQLARLESRLGGLAAQVKKVEGSASWVPPTIRMPSVSRNAPRASRPSSNGSTGASGH